MDFDTAFDKLIGHEGGYSDHPADPGGKTMWGVTEKVARAKGYTGEMRDMPKEWAKSVVYKPSYWDAVKADQLPQEIRFDVFDSAVNSGVGQASKWLQRAVGVQDDGVIGPKTLWAAAGTASLKAKFNGHRLLFMTDLPTWPSFGRGWTRRVAENMKS